MTATNINKNALKELCCKLALDNVFSNYPTLSAIGFSSYAEMFSMKEKLENFYYDEWEGFYYNDAGQLYHFANGLKGFCVSEEKAREIEELNSPAFVVSQRFEMQDLNSVLKDEYASMEVIVCEVLENKDLLFAK